MTQEEFNQLETLAFSYNWNNKLTCQAFTTLRLFNERKYKPNRMFKVFLKEKFLKVVQVDSYKTLKIFDVSEWIARIDTGYTKDDCINIIRKMYPAVNWETQSLMFILLTEVKGDFHKFVAPEK